jgi:regulator of protease activity HflC (stomatin/prohibitin superfamily)
MAERATASWEFSRRKEGKQAPTPGRMGVIWLLIILAATTVFTLLEVVLFPLSALPGPAWRYWLAPLATLVYLLLVGARFVRASYSLASLRNGFRYLLASLFSLNHPILVIAEGKAQLDKLSEQNLIQAIGGPGYLHIQPGNVVLLESLDGKLRVLGAGRHFITRLERVKEVLSLEERFAQVDKIAATSRDGIEVVARDIRYRYRLDPGASAGQGLGRTPENPYPYSEQAVIQAVYNRNMSEAGLGEWHTAVNSVVESLIADYIRQNLVDHLTAPILEGEDPRGEIHRRFLSESGSARFAEKGAELLWIDIGHFETPEKQVAEQRVNTWQARWRGNANVIRAYGESQRLAYEEIGRAEAQAEMLMSIVHGLEDVAARGESRQKIRALYLARIAQLLDAMGKQQALPPGEPANR